MDYIRTFKSIINSHYLSEGVRITTGVLLPAFVFAYFDALSIGIVFSLGALFVSVTDSPGPIHHRKNGMVVCIASILLVTILGGFAALSHIALAIVLCLVCFFFSMITIYGARAGGIGTAAMLVLTLTIDPRLNLTTPTLILQHSLTMASGGLWYMCFSMLLYNFRPYRLAQQALGDCIQATAEYLSIRAAFYKRNVDYDGTYSKLLQQQVIVQNKQTELTELLLKTRDIVKESTNVGRALVMIHLDTADIFERIMMSHQQYQILHEFFDETDILEDYFKLAKELADELDEVGIAVKSGERTVTRNNLFEHIGKTREKLDNLRLTYLKPDNIEGFISLRRILENIQDLAERLITLHKYTNYNKVEQTRPLKETGFEKLITSQPITPQMFIDNLTLKSDAFRHSLRVSIAIFIGYIVALFFNIGHSYWILLTIVVILKPAFSLTKKRNGDRLAGTLIGIVIGVAVLFVVHNNTVLLILLIIFMAGSYTFMRTNYFLSVTLMTPYLVLFYHLLNPHDFNALLKDRILDTLIGSGIAFTARRLLFPSWEREKFKPVMVSMLTEAKNYFNVISEAFINKTINKSNQQLARKNALVALANLSDAFTRMLSEPKSQQRGIETLHQFVVLNHMLTSYIATLSHYLQTQQIPDKAAEFGAIAKDIEHYFTKSIKYLEHETIGEDKVSHKEALRKLNEQVNAVLQQRRQELEQGLIEAPTRKILFDLKSIVDQFNLIYNVARDLSKVTKQVQIE